MTGERVPHLASHCDSETLPRVNPKFPASVSGDYKHLRRNTDQMPRRIDDRVRSNIIPSPSYSHTLLYSARVKIFFFFSME